MQINPFKFIRHFIGRRGNRHQSMVRLSPGERAGILLEACLYIRTGQFRAAQGMLLQLEERDAARLNLLGVIWEINRDWPRARKLYGQAMRADRGFAPPRQNLQRWYELVTLGASSLPMLLGDEGPQWWCERSQPCRPVNRRVMGMWLVSLAGSEVHHEN